MEGPLSKLVGLMVVAAVQLGGAFGAASAEVEELTEQSMIIEIEVEVLSSADAVVAHLSFVEEPSFTMPLLDRGEGIYGVRTELEPKNYVVIFEAVGPGEVSEARTLTQLGADLDPAEAAEPGSGEGDDEGLSPETKRLGWLAVALGAASLSALAFWALGGRDRDPDREERDAVREEE